MITYPSDKVSFCVEDLVPERMQFVNIVVILEREQVSSFVTINKLFVKAILAVERLYDVTNVMNEQTERVRLSIALVTRVESILNVIIDVRVKVGITIFLSEPCDKVCDAYCQIATFVWKVVIRG